MAYQRVGAVGEDIQIRFHHIGTDGAGIARFQFGQVGEHIAEPETEEGIAEPIQAPVSFRLVYYRRLGGKLAPHNTQVHQVAEIGTEFRFFNLRAGVKVVHMGVALGDRLDDGVVVTGLPQFVVQQELHFAVEDAAAGQDLLRNIFFQRQAAVKLLQVVGDAAQNTVSLDLVFHGIVGEELDRLVKIERQHFQDRGGASV